MLSENTYSHLRKRAMKWKIYSPKIMDKLLDELLNWKLDDLDWYDLMKDYSKKVGFELKQYCCRNQPKYAIIYNMPSGLEEPAWLVCEEHFKRDCFSRGIKKMVKL